MLVYKAMTNVCRGRLTLTSRRSYAKSLTLIVEMLILRLFGAIPADANLLDNFIHRKQSIEHNTNQIK